MADVDGVDCVDCVMLDAVVTDVRPMVSAGVNDHHVKGRRRRQAKG